MAESISPSVFSSESEIPTPICLTVDFDPHYDWEAELARLEASEPFPDTVVPETPDLGICPMPISKSFDFDPNYDWAAEYAKLEARTSFSDTVVPETPDLGICPMPISKPFDFDPNYDWAAEYAKLEAMTSFSDTAVLPNCIKRAKKPDMLKCMLPILAIYCPLVLTLPEYQLGLS